MQSEIKLNKFSQATLKSARLLKALASLQLRIGQKEKVLFNSPISEQKADQIIGILELKSAFKVLDVGCGEGEFLSRIHRKSNADCLGIDMDKSCIESANRNVQQNTSSKKLRYLLADIREVQLERNDFDIAICIGSSHAFGEGEAAYPNTLRELNDLVKPNGLILVGEGFWRQSPEPEYLDFLGNPVGIYNSHEKNIEHAMSIGLIPMYAAVSNQDEWDHFEWCFLMNAERKMISEPDNQAAQEKLKKLRQWNQYYRKFGRTTMGFGFYLYLKPE